MELVFVEMKRKVRRKMPRKTRKRTRNGKVGNTGKEQLH